mmetsp:Transcript_24350/g.64014  ORF Transcript_24350/g.64014 Transcript_24350/m.64014 type:complete len:103 (+) Transcript_24350:205-513(+)
MGLLTNLTPLETCGKSKIEFVRARTTLEGFSKNEAALKTGQLGTALQMTASVHHCNLKTNTSTGCRVTAQMLAATFTQIWDKTIPFTRRTAPNSPEVSCPQE